MRTRLQATYHFEGRSHGDDAKDTKGDPRSESGRTRRRCCLSGRGIDFHGGSHDAWPWQIGRICERALAGREAMSRPSVLLA
jgi:hypothetical protein